MLWVSLAGLWKYQLNFILLLQRGYFITCKVQTDFGLFYKRSENSNLIGFSDSDYARDLEDMKSTSGHVFMLSSEAISWSSNKQHLVHVRMFGWEEFLKSYNIVSKVLHIFFVIIVRLLNYPKIQCSMEGANILMWGFTFFEILPRKLLSLSIVEVRIKLQTS